MADLSRSLDSKCTLGEETPDTETSGIARITRRFRVRDAISDQDAAQVRQIYAPMVTESTASFEFEIPTEEDMKQRIALIQVRYPYLVCETNDGVDDQDWTVCGFALACDHHPRAGYQWVVEIGIAVAPKFQGKGIGTLLYNKLFSILTQQGYFKALAVISEGNENSINFHKRLGFNFVMEWKNCGYKFGKWCGNVWYEKLLQPEFIDNPPPPLPYPEIRSQISLDSL